MRPFRFSRIESVSAALDAAGVGGSAKYIAGGTNILDLMKDDVEGPALLIDINALPLRTIELRSDRLYIGALARMSDVASHAAVRSSFPMIASSLDQSASPQLRNMASIGGNILQRTRCPYFRDVATPCNKRTPASGCGAIGGINRMQAILGTSDQCIATHASDLAVTLVALDAIVHVTGSKGDRDVSIHDFYQLPQANPNIETTLHQDELITAVSVPLLPFAHNSTYLKVRDRMEYEFALASAAVAIEISNNSIGDVRIALGGVGTIPWRSRQAERTLIGAPATRDSFERAAEAALLGARGHGENNFKVQLAKRTLVRAIEITLETA
ncbi:MAG TPA: xanthine dehydrogenase family protein subunit M [Candidatus Eremiobacteraceae bacterium]